MNDAYAADIGDFIKFSLLRKLVVNKELGFCWYRTKGPSGGDGRHVDYLHRPNEWRHHDPELFDSLRAIVFQDRRSIASLIEASLIPSARHYIDPVAIGPSREAWVQNMKLAMQGCDLVFLDPDNGIASIKASQTSLSVKHAYLSEISALCCPSRPAIIYHHLGRTGSHEEQIHAVGTRLKRMAVGAVAAIHARQRSGRVFFLLGFDRPLWDCAKDFAKSFGEGLDFEPITEAPNMND